MAIGAAAAYPLLGLVRRVPVPLALIGAGLLLSRKGGTSGEYRSPQSNGEYRSTQSNGEYASASLNNGGESLNGGGESLGDTVRSRLEDAQSTVADAGAKVKDMAAAAAADAAARASRMSGQAGDALAGVLQRNPILVGGVAMAVGGLIAASLPVSRAEEQAVSEAGAALKRSGRRMAAEAIKGAKARAARVAEAMSAAAREEGLTPEDLDQAVDGTADKLGSVAGRAVDAALGIEPVEQWGEDSNDGDNNARF
jgi:hypothetical protein